MITNENAPDAGRHEASSFEAFCKSKYTHNQVISQSSILDALGKRHTFQTFGDAYKSGSLARVMHGTLEECRPELGKLNRRGAGIFFTVNETTAREELPTM